MNLEGMSLKKKFWRFVWPSVVAAVNTCKIIRSRDFTRLCHSYFFCAYGQAMAAIRTDVLILFNCRVIRGYRNTFRITFTHSVPAPFSYLI